MLYEKETSHDEIVNEAARGLSNARGTISMARRNDPDSAADEFFVNLVDNSFLDHDSGQDGYAAFGTLLDGFEVLDAIGSVPTHTVGSYHDVPTIPVVIHSVRRRATTPSCAPTATHRPTSTTQPTSLVFEDRLAPSATPTYATYAPSYAPSTPLSAPSAMPTPVPSPMPTPAPSAMPTPPLSAAPSTKPTPTSSLPTSAPTALPCDVDAPNIKLDHADHVPTTLEEQEPADRAAQFVVIVVVVSLVIGVLGCFLRAKCADRRKDASYDRAEDGALEFSPLGGLCDDPDVTML